MTAPIAPVTFQARVPASIRSHSPWLWLGFKRTAGIERYRRNEQYAAWWFTHCQLKNSDASYAGQCDRFRAQLLCSFILSCVLFFALSMSYSLAPSMFLSALGSGSASFLFWASEQRRRNEWIGRRFIAEAIPVTK